MHLRTQTEESYQTLLNRVKEMELSVDKDRQYIGDVNSNCELLKKELIETKMAHEHTTENYNNLLKYVEEQKQQHGIETINNNISL